MHDGSLCVSIWNKAFVIVEMSWSISDKSDECVCVWVFSSKKRISQWGWLHLIGYQTTGMFREKKPCEQEVFEAWARSQLTLDQTLDFRWLNDRRSESAAAQQVFGEIRRPRGGLTEVYHDFPWVSSGGEIVSSHIPIWTPQQEIVQESDVFTTAGASTESSGRSPEQSLRSLASSLPEIHLLCSHMYLTRTVFGKSFLSGWKEIVQSNICVLLPDLSCVSLKPVKVPVIIPEAL